MREFLLVCFALSLGACSLAGDYDRPYDETYRPIEGFTVGPSFLPDAQIPDEPVGEGDAGIQSFLGRACTPVVAEWPVEVISCRVVCEEARRRAMDCASPQSFAAFMEGVCLELCIDEGERDTRAFFSSDEGREAFCGGAELDVCPIGCILCEGETTPYACLGECENDELWKCMGFNAYRLDPNLFEVSPEDLPAAVGLQLTLGSALDACLQVVEVSEPAPVYRE